MAVDSGRLNAELAGLDDLDQVVASRPPIVWRLWSALWPKLAAAVMVIAAWQILVWTHWKSAYVLPGPDKVLPELGRQLQKPVFWHGLQRTMERAVIGYSLALLVGTALGLVVLQSSFLRRAFGSLITGVQTMPSIAWFPLAILFFKLNESAILFVVVLGAAPSIANGLIGGVDHIPPLLLRSGRMLGARGPSLYRHIILPAALPSFVGGLKQGWAFAWRSLMAGELLVIVAGHPSLGVLLQNARDVSDASWLLSMMIVILIVGIVVDSLFTAADTSIRRRWGLLSS
jgi:NitT/TauT family transport system permease protein